MTGFSEDWLALREPADSAARSRELAGLLARQLADRPRDAPLEVVDLGCGSGANLRWLAPRLPGPQHWHLLDDDPALLAAARRRLARWAGKVVEASVTTGRLALETAGGTRLVADPRRVDLARDLAAVAIPEQALVTASALVDLVSRRWLEALVARCAAARASLLLALTYDGRVAWSPALPDDSTVHRLHDRHQGTDKGFGPALGPTAVAVAAALLRDAGYTVHTATSDWRLGADDAPLARALADGWCRAASDLEPGRRDAFRAWSDDRARLADTADAALVVGHLDLLAELA
ncbi:MAG: methyltransferase domain-containing protein [Chromatiales bacterium]|nr:methyltransferase domain-containing protein [Chromatiales bacterium]